MQLLIQAGADLRAKNENGETPLICAMKRGRPNKENIKALICMSTKSEINEADIVHRTVFHHLFLTTKNTAFLTEMKEVALIKFNTKYTNYFSSW